MIDLEHRRYCFQCGCVWDDRESPVCPATPYAPTHDLDRARTDVKVVIMRVPAAEIGSFMEALERDVENVRAGLPQPNRSNDRN